MDGGRRFARSLTGKAGCTASITASPPRLQPRSDFPHIQGQQPRLLRVARCQRLPRYAGLAATAIIILGSAAFGVGHGRSPRPSGRCGARCARRRRQCRPASVSRKLNIAGRKQIDAGRNPADRRRHRPHLAVVSRCRRWCARSSRPRPGSPKPPSPNTIPIGCRSTSSSAQAFALWQENGRISVIAG